MEGFQNDPAVLVDKPLLFDEKAMEIPFVSYVLSNGLKLIVHEDHKAPIAAVNVWYHVGSKNEVQGRSGLAHLFEHLMFNGSENFNDDYFQALMHVGATDVNGTTNCDRTNYFQNVPVAALERVLWLESDRMGHLLGALDQGKLDEQRGVVKNEKRQRENAPYGKEQELILKEMYPPGHPYSWPVIGYMKDLDETSVEDCHEWFKAYYGAANAVIVVAGDVQAEQVREQVEFYFGDIPAGPPIVRPGINIPVRSADTRMSFQDRVPEAKVTMVWNTAQLGVPEDALLDLAAAVLSRGKNARLYKRLVYDKRLCSNASAAQWSREIAGNFFISAHAKPGVPIATIEAEVEEVLQDFIENGPTPEELDRVRNQFFASFIKGLERIGGFGGKSDLLASSMTFGGAPDAYRQYNTWIAEATPEAIRMACRKWLTKGRFTLVCDPLPEYKTLPPQPSNRAMPALREITAGTFPGLQRKKLDNGLEIVLAARSGSPTVVMQTMCKRGYVDDGALQGLATLTMRMLDEGAGRHTGLEISEMLQRIGAGLSCSSGLEYSEVRLSALKPALEEAFGIYLDVLLDPTFPEEELQRLKKEQLDGIAREKVTPMSMALRVVPRLLFGKGHQYDHPFTGTGIAETVAQIEVEDIRQFYHTHITPNQSVLIVAGDLTMEDVLALGEDRLNKWKPSASSESRKSAEVADPSGTLYFLDRPGSLQSIVIGAHLIDPYQYEKALPTDILNDIVGGQFISRINMNLREDKHWTYGARSMVLHTSHQRPYLVYSSVQMDKTQDAIREILREFEEIRDVRPVTEEEFGKTRTNILLGLPGQWETNAAVADSVENLLKLDLPDDYYSQFPAQLNALTKENVQAMTEYLIKPDHLMWVVVGDKEKTLPDMDLTVFRKVVFLNGEGEEVR